MNQQQPEALRLADLFELESDQDSLYRKAAAEFRRLHAENQVLHDLCKRSLRALSEDDFPILREELRHFTQEEGQDD